MMGMKLGAIKKQIFMLFEVAYATIDIVVRSAIRHFLKRNSDEYPSPMNGFRLVMNSP